MKVLVADDEKVTRHMLERFLNNWGLEVVVSENGREAWDRFQEQPFHFVISDWNMPEINGLELVERIRSCKSSDYVYLMLLTSRSDKEDLVMGLDAGADDFLSKPFDRSELRARIRAGERIITLQRELEQRNRSLLAAKQRMERNLEAAARLQQSLLPNELPKSNVANFAWSFRPCEELAGDNLNVFQLDDDLIGFYVADVSGHGVAAALLSVTINQILSPQKSVHGLLVKPDGDDSSKSKISSPKEVAEELNRRFPMDEFNGNYFTIVYGVLDTDASELTYISAGHPPIILISSDGGSTLLENTGRPIGWSEKFDIQERVYKLSPGDRLCIYSDGLPDAENGLHEEFGDQRLVESLTSSISMPIDDCVSEAMLKIETWCGTNRVKDDMSMLAIEISD